MVINGNNQFWTDMLTISGQSLEFEHNRIVYSFWYIDKFTVDR